MARTYGSRPGQSAELARMWAQLPEERKASVVRDIQAALAEITGGHHPPMTFTHRHEHSDGGGGRHSHVHAHDGDNEHAGHAHDDGGARAGRSRRPQDAAGDRQAWPLAVRIRAEAGETRVDVFDDVGEGPFGGGLSARAFAEQLAGIRGAVRCHISSSGGDVFDGLAIFNSLRAHKGRVTTVVDGLAASIASVIALAGDERVARPGSMYMVHDAFGVCVGNEAEMAKFAQTLGQVSQNLAAVYADRCGGTPAAWRDVMRAETWYTADEAVAAGLADRVSGQAAQMPASVGVAAAGTVPGRIAARLRVMPQAAGLRAAGRERAAFAAAWAALPAWRQEAMIREMRSALGELLRARGRQPDRRQG